MLRPSQQLEVRAKARRISRIQPATQTSPFERLCVNVLGKIASFLPERYCFSAFQLRHILQSPFPYQRVVVLLHGSRGQHIEVRNILKEACGSECHSLRELRLFVENDQVLDQNTKALVQAVFESRVLRAAFVNLPQLSKAEVGWLCNIRPRWSTCKVKVVFRARDIAGVALPSNDWIIAADQDYQHTDLSLRKVVESAAVSCEACTGLKHFAICNAVIRDEAQPPLYFGKIRSLEHFSVRDCVLPSRALYSMVRGVIDSSGLNISKLSIVNCGLCHEELTELVRALSFSTSVQHLDLSKNHLARASCVALGRWIASNCGSRLRSLFLNECGLSTKLAKALLRSFRSDTQLQELSLLDLAGRVYKLTEAFNRFPKLVTLRVGSHRFSRLLTETSGSIFHDVSAVVFAIRTHLKVLDLSRWFVKDHGAYVLGRAIDAASGIKELILNECGIGASGAANLSVSLSREDCGLERLELVSNPLTEDGVLAIAGALRHNVRLKEIDLRGVELGSRECRSALLAALRWNNTLDLVRVDSCVLNYARLGTDSEGVRARCRIACHEYKAEKVENNAVCAENIPVAANRWAR